MGDACLQALTCSDPCVSGLPYRSTVRSSSSQLSPVLISAGTCACTLAADMDEIRSTVLVCVQIGIRWGSDGDQVRCTEHCAVLVTTIR